MSGRAAGRSTHALTAVVFGLALAGGIGQADATIISLSPNTDFSTMSTAINFGGVSYTFSAIPGAIPGNPPAAVATGGMAQVSSFGGGVADFGAGATIDGTGLYGFSSFPSPNVIPNSAADDFIGLAFTLSDGLHYGYAEIAGTSLISYAYESVAGAGIVTGAVPEPATFAILGAGLAGLFSIRRRVRDPILKGM